MQVLDTAGERLAIDLEPLWVRRLVTEAVAGESRPGADADATVVVRVERSRSAFRTEGWAQLARGVHHHDGCVVLRDACGSGFDVHVRVQEGRPVFTARWRPSLRVRAASLVLRSRFHLLVRAVLVQYPVLWWAGVMGRAPLHISGLTLGTTAAVLSGPGGVGKSTLLARAVAEGSRAVADNLCVSDGERVWGLVEPLRTEGGSGRRMPHGRREGPLPGRLASLRPDQLFVLRRSGGERFEIAPIDHEGAVRDLVCGTYAAGELRRYWPWAAVLAAGTGLGPPHPSVTATAEGLASSVACRSVGLPRLGAAGPADLRTRLEACP